MHRDIDTVIAELQRAHPSIACEQLRVTHPTDDDGLWFFTHPDRPGEVQLESTTGQVPFLVEGTESPARDTAHSVEQAVALVATRLGLIPRTG
ncbi:MAG: hypothetical protein K0S86_835 [Geminicoccaceae bacterium]|nr:hypothetical protein [Geminicoccaceae bacterium]